MRNRHLLLIFSAVAALSLSACDDDDHDANTDGAAGSGGSAGAAGNEGGAGNAGDTGANEDGGAGDGGNADSGEDGGAGDASNADSGEDGGVADGGDTDSGEDGGVADGGDADSGEDGGDADGGDAGSDGAVVVTCATACAKFSDCSEACSQNLVELCLAACEESQAAELNEIEKCIDAISLLDLVTQCATQVDLGDDCDLTHLCSSPAECIEGTCKQSVDLGANCDSNKLCKDSAKCDTDHICKLFDIELGKDCDPTHICASGLECISETCKKYVDLGANCNSNELCKDSAKCDTDNVCKLFNIELGKGCDPTHICASGLECISETCKKHVDLGDACSDDELCSSPAECIDDHCKQYVDLGQPCNDSYACQSPARCDTDSLCKLFDIKLGATCDPTHICSSELECAGNRCLEPGIGESCDETHLCQGSLQCEFGKCKAFVSVQSYCDENHVCAGQLQCSDGQCKRPAGDLSAECTDSSECLEGICQPYGDGQYCLLSVGDSTRSAASCVSHTVRNKLCALPFGGTCSLDEDCGSSATCAEGSCKRKLAASGGYCNSSSECPTGASCQKNFSGSGPYCYLDGGQITTEGSSCASNAIYDDNGIKRCKSIPGENCSTNSESCIGICEDGTCKKLGKTSGSCNVDTECATDASCQTRYDGYGPWCLFDDGEETTSSDLCASNATYSDANGTLRCKYLLGGNCDGHPEICTGACGEDGICKRLGSASGYCSDQNECASGASCQMNYTGSGPYCIFSDGQKTTDKAHCASYQTYTDDDDSLYCKHILGGDCSTNPEICVGACGEDGTCKRLGSLSGHCSDDDECPTGASCQRTQNGSGPWCYFNRDEKTTTSSDCVSFSTYRDDDGTLRCGSLPGEACSQRSGSCVGTCEDGICKRPIGRDRFECSSNNECTTDASCQEWYAGGSYCFFEGGQLTNSYRDCASDSIYYDNYQRRCRYLLGGDCSQVPGICMGACDGGTCKRLGSISGYCNADSECAIDASCQLNASGRGPYCLLNGGQETEDGSNCASGKSYDDSGISRCSFLPGADCSQNPMICAGTCENGICKQMVDAGNGNCNDSAECVTGASCQLNASGRGPYCLLDDGRRATGPEDCASNVTHLESGIPVCGPAN